MNTKKKEFNLNYGGKTVTIETGRLAKQADGAAFVTCGGTQVLVTVCSDKEVKSGQDFFPLLVDYKEKFFSAGKFLGGFRKREGRPTDQEVLLMRMIDRPFRPLFPEGYMTETIIQATVYSYDADCDPEVLTGLGAAAALAFSDIPFSGPVGFCKVGKIDGKLVLNPSKNEWAKSELELVIGATKEAVSMIEGEADELSEEEMLEAIMFGHDHIKQFCDFLAQAAKEVGKPKRDFTPILPKKNVLEKVEEKYHEKARRCLGILDKLERRDAIADLKKEVIEAMNASPGDFAIEDAASAGKDAPMLVEELLSKMMRKDILEKEKRIGNRSLTGVRPIETEVDVLKRTHGSSLFTRGETQVLAAVTIGGKEGEQTNDVLSGTTYDKFYLHYTFPPFSVGEARGYRGVGRREIGHGNLAERALKKVLPSLNDFPYTVRVNCEVLESNGSSSMGSVCSGSMALMDAGVPLRSAVAGVAMGLIKEENVYKILTDILGDEDHLGDMDFKVAGTEKGITAIQMDIKIAGIGREIFEEALAQAKAGRLHILKEMAKTLDKPRPDFKEGVPRILTVKTDPDKIGGFIGPGGKYIKAFQERFSVSVECLDDGTIKIMGADSKKLADSKDQVEMQLNGPKLGQDYNAVVVAIKEYGAFVDIAPNVSGLLHISEITDSRVKDVSEYLDIGDQVKVRVLEIDRFGKIKFSAKAVGALDKKTKS